jgi:hypothetical protein
MGPTSPSRPANARREVVLIGPVMSGKSTVGDLVAAHLGVPHIDVDHVADPYYARSDWSVTRFEADERARGLEVAMLAAEDAMVAAAVGTLDDYTDCVFSFGAAHSHYRSPAHFERVRRALVPFANVVLLLPGPDVDSSVAVLRRRCRDAGGRAWTNSGYDALARWVADDCNRRLATVTVFTNGRTAVETAAELVELTGLSPAPERLGEDRCG